MGNMTNLLLLGGGGHCLSVIESIESTGLFNIIGISDIPERVGTSILGYKVIVSDQDMINLKVDNLQYLITIGQIKTAEPRIQSYSFLKTNNLPVATIIDSSSIVSKRAIIQEGTVVLRHSFINSEVKIGHNCIINSRAIIEHSSLIGNNVHISTGAIVNGDCIIGDRCFVGSGAIISNGVTVCPDSIIGAGSIVLSSIQIPGTYLGNPARRIK
jgi:sugar O-acyltransferase (sialic acid O-acetyltransferase NeuD family)